MKRILPVVMAVMVSLWGIGCSSTKITRVDREQKIDLSGSFNDYDAMLIAKDMVKDCLEKPWLSNFMAGHNGKIPAVIVGYVSNRSYEHINSQIFTKSLERELLNSGKVLFVASPEEREQIREERSDQQQGNTLPETIKKIGKERGADLLLIGSINALKDEVKGRYAILYQVNLELIDLESNDKMWIGQKEIKKLVEQKKFSL